jgi:UDP-N-acetylglucosamine 2-epimerase (non-hydrolysing)
LPCAFPRPGRKLVLITAHRRENFGAPLLSIIRAIQRLHDEQPDVDFVYPVHPNPNVRGPVYENLAGLERLHLMDPVNYLELTALMKNCHFALTDSGGIQEEAPALGKPVLVLRSETERPEAVQAGVAKLVGTDEDVSCAEATRLLTDARGLSRHGARRLALWRRQGGGAHRGAQQGLPESLISAKRQRRWDRPA